MNKLMEKKPILHAILWILIYVVMVNIGDMLSELTEFPYLTGLLLLALSVFMALYLKESGRVSLYGIKKITKQDARKTLFYIPMILLAFIQLFAGIVPALSITKVAIACLLMIGTGFVEELIFRGFLFYGIYGKSGVNKAIIISGITFGIGHIVNLLRGYTSLEQLEQIVIAIMLGIILALLVAITKNIIPGILFHIVFNITGTISNAEGNISTYLMLAILVISLFYAIYLYRFVQKSNEY